MISNYISAMTAIDLIIISVVAIVLIGFIGLWMTGWRSEKLIGKPQHAVLHHAKSGGGTRLTLYWRYIAAAMLIWTAVIGGSLVWNFHLLDEQLAELAHKEAVANFDKDQGFRLWGTKHGGVYVPVTEETPPSPYLSHIPERDIETPSGRKLTLMNPAYMVRQLMEDYTELYGVRGHITGLTVLRPGNAPDEWEMRALLRLQGGADEVIADTEIDGQLYHRMMRPMYMKPGCEKCHGHLGFKLGDFRGGVSVSVPLAPYIASRRDGAGMLAISHSLIWMLGMAGIGFGARQVRSRIEERDRAGEQLDAHRARFETLLNLAPDAFIVMDEERRIQLFSEGAVNAFGYRPEEVVGERIEILMPEIHRAVHPRHVRNFAASGQTTQRLGERGELTGRHKDGSTFPAEASVARLELAGETVFTATLRDITERKRTEDRLRDAIESIADGLVLFDSDDRVVMWNQRFADMYPELAAMLPNNPTAEDMFRERYRVGAVGDFDVSAEEYVRWRLEMRQKQGGMPAVHRHKDGRWFRTTERRTIEGGVVAISTDVTELKNSEMDQRDARHQAELANRSKSEFLANISHELRTPLNAVIGFSEIIAGGMFGPVGNAKYLGYANDIHDSGQHLLALINNILDLSKVEAGKLELDEQMVDVTEVLEASMTLVKERAEEAELGLETHVSEGLPAIYADPVKVKQALINLLSNAVKFTRPGGAISVHAFVEPNGDLAIRVADTGVGIAPENIPQMMEPFGQAEDSLTRQHQGTGLGLPLSKALIELHEGTLALESELGVGTNVTIRFPAERVRDCAA